MAEIKNSTEVIEETAALEQIARPSALQPGTAPAAETLQSSDDNKRALVVAAHPDDAEFGCAGTAFLWSQDGWEFHYLICTDGSKGTDDPEMTPDKLVPLRREEQRAAAKVLGVKSVNFLDYVDGTLTYNSEFLRDVVRYIRLIKPRAVFTHDPTQVIRNSFINHPDHRCTGTVTIDAVYPMARNRPSFPELLTEGLDSFKVKELYLWASENINFEVDITEAIDVKFAALRKHASQFHNFEEMEARFRQRFSEPDGRFLEKFRRIEMQF
ncbi:MAG TPA: PIG-L deacetylase family protein [Dehalococcoidia bacterium]|nr:PIG-L deacetylase family protein [Dehalococcoidia bacterium]